MSKEREEMQAILREVVNSQQVLMRQQTIMLKFMLEQQELRNKLIEKLGAHLDIGAGSSRENG